MTKVSPEKLSWGGLVSDALGGKQDGKANGPRCRLRLEARYITSRALPGFSNTTSPSPTKADSGILPMQTSFLSDNDDVSVQADEFKGDVQTELGQWSHLLIEVKKQVCETPESNSSFEK